MDNRPSALQLAIIGAVLVFVGGVGLWATQAPENELAHRFVVALTSLVTGIPIIIGFLVLSQWGVACVPTLVRAYDWWQARKSSQNVTKSVTNEAETKTAYAKECRDFYIDLACLSADNENGLGRVKVFKGQLTDEQWRAWVREPLVAATVAIRKNTVGGETAMWAYGWTPAKFAHWIEFGNLPPHPNELPPKLDRAVRQDKEYKGNTSDYSGDTDNTVYASEAK